MGQKLFDVERYHMRNFLHCFYGGNGAEGILQHRITFLTILNCFYHI